MLGVDGCKGGWIGVFWTQGRSRVQLFASFAEVVAQDAACIGIDMPIGIGAQHGRRAEQAARALLGPRRSSVFSVPSRGAVQCTDYRQACVANLQHSDPARKVSQQSFHLFKKICEVDALMTPESQSRIHEVHPEVSFCQMNGGQPLRFAKKSRGGERERLGLLAEISFPVPDLDRLGHPRSKVGRDDVIDACAAAWSAQRIILGNAVCLPEHPDRDERGLLMSIKA